MRRLIAAALAAALLVACSGDDDDAGPSPTTDPTTSTSAVDRSGIALAGVEGATTTSILDVGRATIVGEVRGPSGPVPGATVRIERLVGGQERRRDVVTGPDGRYLLEKVPGGRYRVRAFLPPSLAQVEPVVRFLEDGAEHQIDLEVQAFGGVEVLADAAPDTPLLGQAVNVVAVVITRSVDAEGIVRAEPVAGITVELGGLGRWVLRREPPQEEATTTTTSEPFDTSSTSSSSTTTTTEAPPPDPVQRADASGRVRFELECLSPGEPGLYLLIPVRSVSSDPPASTTTAAEPEVRILPFDLTLPACVDPATTTTTTAPTTTTVPTTTR